MTPQMCERKINIHNWIFQLIKLEIIGHCAVQSIYLQDLGQKTDQAKWMEMSSFDSLIRIWRAISFDALNAVPIGLVSTTLIEQSGSSKPQQECCYGLLIISCSWKGRMLFIGWGEEGTLGKMINLVWMQHKIILYFNESCSQRTSCIK